MAHSPLAPVLDQIRRLCDAPPDLDAASDGRLLELFLHQRAQAAFATLLQRHGPMVLGVARRLLGHHHDAEDVSQPTSLLLAQKADATRQADSVAGWLHAVARRLALKARGRNASRQARERQAPTMEPSTPDPAARRELAD